MERFRPNEFEMLFPLESVEKNFTLVHWPNCVYCRFLESYRLSIYRQKEISSHGSRVFTRVYCFHNIGTWRRIPALSSLRPPPAPTFGLPATSKSQHRFHIWHGSRRKKTGPLYPPMHRRGPSVSLKQPRTARYSSGPAFSLLRHTKLRV